MFEQLCENLLNLLLRGSDGFRWVSFRLKQGGYKFRGTVPHPPLSVSHNIQNVLYKNASFALLCKQLQSISKSFFK